VAVTSGVLAPFVTVLFMFVLRPVAVGAGLVDVPGGRKRHGAPVPLIGGLAMAMGLGVGVTISNQPEFLYPALLGIYLLVTVGMVDDRYDLPAGLRLLAQTAAALLVVMGSNVLVAELGAPFFFSLSLDLLAVPFTILLILTIINGFNVIDGIDGLAGGTAFLALAALAIIGLGSDVFTLTTLLLTVLAGFLLFNLPLKFNRSVRAFMGDAGSTSLGLAIAFVGIMLCQGEQLVMAPVIGLWLAAVPVFELFSTIVRRLVRGQSPFRPDSEHLHHVLMTNGLSAPATLVVMLALAAGLAGVGLAGHVAGVPDGLMFAGWLASGLLYYRMIRFPRQVVLLVTALRWRAARVCCGS
jgi:UDP-GlcNAc:undecaprenyl-phosphate/decaprenyl-phosphate GlcNAc-1-phosphate transferase